LYASNFIIMKKAGLSIIIALFLIFNVIIVNSQADTAFPASAIWELSNPAAGGTGLTAATAGNILAEEESFGSNTHMKDYTGWDGSQRTQILGGEWPANQTTLIESVHIQFTLRPQSYSIFYLDSISLEITATYINTMKAEVYCSTEPDFATSVQVPFSTGIAGNYIPRDNFFRINSDLDMTVNDGETLYVRVYPWVEDPNVKSGKYICLRNVVISGRIKSLSQSVSVVWPVDAAGNYEITGPLLAEPDSYSDSMKYYGATRLSKYGTTDSIDLGAVHTLDENWQAASSIQDSLYTEYVSGPKYGGTFIIDSVSLWIGGWNTSTLRAEVCYSKDTEFTAKTIIIADSALPDNAAEQWITEINDTVFTGENIFLRIYPYNTITESGGKMLAIHDVSLYGQLEGITADPPAVTTAGLSYLSKTFVTSGGNISADGGKPVLGKGVVWNTSGDPTISDNKTDDGVGTGSFVSQVTGLTAGTDYYLRAYATNEAGTGYGGERTFTTLDSIVIPSVSTSSVSNVMVVSAEGGGKVTGWGGDSVVIRGACWNTTGNPTIADNTSEDGSDLGTYLSFLYPLEESTKYYVRAYATNSAGTGYGNQISFTTKAYSPDVTKVVARDGTGDYTTVQAAFNAAPVNYTGTFTIHVKPGIYYEKLNLYANKFNIVLKGDHPDSTILTYDDNANTAGTTSGSYSAAIEPNDFTAINITFRNTNQETQAVALRVNGDRQSYYGCKLLGYQDTYYTYGTGRIYMKHCYIEGSVDFIFGRSTVVFDSCEINENRNGGKLTAASTDLESKFGYVFLDCKIKADATGYDGIPVGSFVLGRPWQNAPRTVFINCEEPAALSGAGWETWNVLPAVYAEYKCFGPGSDTTYRISISRQLSDEEALDYTVENIFSRNTHPSFSYDWVPDRSFSRLKQTLSFSGLPEKRMGETPFELTAEASSALPVSYTSSNTDVATIDGNTVTLTGTGTTEITASQPGNFLYYSAAGVVQTLTVGEASATKGVRSQGIKIYPNPESSTINIIRPANTPENATIYDIKGQKVMETILNSQEYSIDITSLPEGIYILRIENLSYKVVVN
jgi:pectin methylesterase-like acyl-CoA thioesterase